MDISTESSEILDYNTIYGTEANPAYDIIVPIGIICLVSPTIAYIAYVLYTNYFKKDIDNTGPNNKNNVEGKVTEKIEDTDPNNQTNEIKDPLGQKDELDKDNNIINEVIEHINDPNEKNIINKINELIAETNTQKQNIIKKEITKLYKHKEMRHKARINNLNKKRYAIINLTNSIDYSNSLIDKEKQTLIDEITNMTDSITSIENLHYLINLTTKPK